MKGIYTYLADGTKAGAVDDNGVGFDYLGSFVYTNNSNARSLESAAFGGGKINATNSGYDINYFITDHLNSTRVIVNPVGDILEQNDYYPFGLKHNNANLVSSGNRYRFVGAEMQIIGLVGDIDLGARNYDPFTGRTRTQDRFSEKYYGLSQYGYAANSPVNIIDINGDSLTIIGSQADLQATVDTYNAALEGFYKTSVDVNNGKMSISQVEGSNLDNMTPEQSLYYTALDKIISGTDGMTTLNIVNETAVLFGDVNTGTVDIGDIQALGNGEYVNQSSVLLHETVEQYEVQVVNQNPRDAHRRAVMVERAVTGCRISQRGI